MSFIGAFRKSSSNGAGGSSSHHDSRKDKEVLETDFNKEYKRMSARKVLLTKWVDEGFLTDQGLNNDFTTLVRNAGMEVFSSLNCDTYKRATFEFLATFHDDLAILGRDTTVSFSLNSTLYCLTFEEFCGCFGFSTTREPELTEEVVLEAAEAWRRIFVYMNLNYLRKKSATIQNPTIRYFATFLANSIFAKGDTGAMANPEMSVTCSTLYPNMQHKYVAGFEPAWSICFLLITVI
jgi:hypothetical protein